MDVKSAFLNRDLAEEVYVHEMTGFTIDNDNQVLRLKKTLYGLRQVPRAWYEKLHSSLNELGFMRSDHEDAVYTWRIASRPLVLGVYVDDLLFTEVVNTNINRLKQEMKDCFKMSDLGLLTYYLGIEVCESHMQPDCLKGWGWRSVIHVSHQWRQG
jgi:hypothetical protein